MIIVGDEFSGKISLNSSGNGYFSSENLTKDIFIHKNNLNKALHLDRVIIKLINGRNSSIEGEVVKVIERFRTEFVGTIQVSEKHAFFIPDSVKNSVDFYIPLNKLNGAKDGQKVVARLVIWKDTAKNPNGEIIRVIGNAGDHETEIHSILEDYELPYQFSEDVIKETEAIPKIIPENEIKKRKDMRDILTFTIDPADAKDFDDALSLEIQNNELYIGVHIADVSHYLIPSSNLDKEAYKRGNSIYLVDRCIPMLPEVLSNGLCSLRPNEDKLCFSIIFKIDYDGNILDEWIGKTIINSNKRYTYEEAQYIIENENMLRSENKLNKAIIILHKIAKKLRLKRQLNGSVSFDKHEIKFVLDSNNKPIDVINKVSKDSNKLIEEFMLLANRQVAHFINSKGIPSINRAHAKPNNEKLFSLKTFIKELGYDINLDSPNQISKSLNKLLEDIKGKPEENMINNLIVKTMQKADYRTTNIGHYGLGFDDYSHFTSPIRRYADVLLHRILHRALIGRSNYRLDPLNSKCLYLSEREIKASKAERDSVKYMQCLFMSNNIGKVYKGIVSSVTDYGLYVEIPDYKTEGFIRLSEINNDTYIVDLSRHSIQGVNNGVIIKLGDEINVIIKSVDIERKNIDLSLLNL